MAECTCKSATMSAMPVTHRARRDSPFKIGAVQMSCSPNLEENLQKAMRGIRQAAAQGAEIICLQELFRSQYFCREENAAFFDLAEPVPGPTTEVLSALAKELQVSIVASLFEARPGPVSQHRSRSRCGWLSCRPLSQNAHTGRPALFRKILLHSRRPRFSVL